MLFEVKSKEKKPLLELAQEGLRFPPKSAMITS